MGIEVPEDLKESYDYLKTGALATRANKLVHYWSDERICALIERIATLETAIKDAHVALGEMTTAFNEENAKLRAQLTEAREQIERLQKPVTDEEAHNFGMFTQSGLWFTDDNVDALIRSRSQKAGQ